MQALIEQILEEIRSAWRFRWQALAVAWLVCLIGWFAVLVMPNKFEANARVFVDPSTSLKPVIQGLAVEQDVNAELSLVRQSLLSEPQLRKVLVQAKLDSGVVTEADRAYAIRGLRDRIVIEVQPTSANDVGPSKIYAIKYADTNRDRSLKVVQILLDNFVEGTLGGKREGSQQAQVFLENQIKEYERRLTQSEESLAEFKKKNVGMVPGEQQGDYFTRLQNEMDGVKKAQTALVSAATRREALRRQLRGEAPVAASAGSLGTQNGTSGPGGDTLSRIKETQARLDELLLRFTPKHPDVVAQRENLEQLQERRKTELAALRNGDPNAAALTGASSNPVYQNIQLSLNQAEVEAATLESEVAGHQRKVSELRQMLDTMPQVEAEYARLNRDYSVTKSQYTALAERLEKARVGEDAEASGSVRFEVIDPPAADFKPVSPQRSMLLAAVLLGGVGAGGGLAYLLNLLRPVFGSIEALKAATGLNVLGAISLSRSPAEVSGLRRSYVLYSTLVLGLVGGLAGAWLVSRRFAPLTAAALGL